MGYDAIPAELRLLKQWCVWNYVTIEGQAKPTKIPYNPITGRKASVSDSNTWCSYDDAISFVDNYSGIGFIFTVDDPYCGIDFDANGNIEQQLALFKSFDSYSEISPSGKGLHIIVKGTVPSGAKKNDIEVYSSGRFFTMTGNVHHDVPIAERQSLLLDLYKALKPNDGNKNDQYVNQDEKYTDEQIIDQCRKADNGEKFTRLYKGEYGFTDEPGMVGDRSQSAADLALINIIAFYTKNRNQIQRIFLSSGLGKRSKAKRQDYMQGMITKSFDRELSLVNIDDFEKAIKTKLNNAGSSKGKTVDFESINGSSILPPATIIIPPGLMGQLTNFIYYASNRPVWEIALAGAIGLMAGICGKAYNFNKSGLNLYVLTVADTGVGKEAASQGIDLLMAEVSKQVLVANEFIGPSEIASGQALLNFLKGNQSFVCVLGEWGYRLQTICDPRAHGAEKVLLRVLLDLFGKSGEHRTLGGHIYSDKEKSTKAVEAPSMSILADTTPETFYSVLNEDMVNIGLLPRFLIIEYKGKRAYENKNPIEIPDAELIKRMVDLTSSVKSLIHNHKTTYVQITQDAREMLDKFDVYSTDIMNEADKGFVKHLWNRAQLKIQRLASLVAIGINAHNPVIDLECINWAATLIAKDIELLSAKFETGDIGNASEKKQENEIIRIMIDYVNKNWINISKYVPEGEEMHAKKIIPYRYINKRLASTSIFSKDRIGATMAMKRALQALIDTNRIVELNKVQLKSEHRAFMINPNCD